MREELMNINWDNTFQPCENINQMVLKFEEIIEDITKKHVPLKKTSNRTKPQSPWLNFKAIKAIRRKYHAWKRFQTSKTHNMYLNYVKERIRLVKS